MGGRGRGAPAPVGRCSVVAREAPPALAGRACQSASLPFAMAGGEEKAVKAKSKAKAAAPRGGGGGDDGEDGGGAAAEAARAAVQEGRRLLDVALDLGVRPSTPAAAIFRGSARSRASPPASLTACALRAPQVLARTKAAAPRELQPSKGAARGCHEQHRRSAVRQASPASAAGTRARAHARPPAALLAASGRDVQKSAAARKNRYVLSWLARCAAELATRCHDARSANARLAPPDAASRHAATSSCCPASWRPRAAARWCAYARCAALLAASLT